MNRYNSLISLLVVIILTSPSAFAFGVNEMVEARKVANKMDDEKEKANAYSKTIAPFLDKIRYHIDKLELIVDDEIWPLPKYRELLFTS